MTVKTVRKIVHIDEEKCNGCGSCTLKCAEGALRIIEGKARLLSETYCDGLGACLGECPQGAITIEERPAEEFDEKAVEDHIIATRHTCPGSTVQDLRNGESGDALPCGCSGDTVQELSHEQNATQQPESVPLFSRLGHWPVQMTLVPPSAPFLKNADIVLTADCVPFSYPNFHEDFLKDRAVLVACPKLDDFGAHQEKLTQILQTAHPKSLTVVHMEVPCCSGLVFMARQAATAAGTDIPDKKVTIGIKGRILTTG